MEPAVALLTPMLGAVAVQRLLELALSRRNEQRLLERGAQRRKGDGFLPIAGVQAAVFVALPFEVVWAPWTGLGLHTWLAVSLWAMSNLLRYWCVLTLGTRWCVRVLRLPGVPLVDRGPYRWLRHPNYLGVAVELVALCFIFGAVVTGVVLGLANWWALRNRIRIEERFLGLSAD